MRSIPRLLVLLVLLLSTWIAYSQAAAPATQPNSRKTSTPYTGDLARFDSPGREERLQLPRVMEILGINAGKNVADIGAGSGWFTVHAAKRVGDAGMVYAVDINPEAVRHIEDRIKKEHVKNVRAILSKPEDPMLPAESVDAVLMLKTYHEVADPVTLLRKLRPALRADARVGIIERNGNGEDHGINRDVVIREAKEAGYVVAQEMDWKHDEMDYFLVLRMQ